MDNEYYLVNKQNEIIKKVQSESFENALEFFSKMKKLNKTELLKIYNIVEKNKFKQ